MSTTTLLGVTPDRRPVKLAELRVAQLWSPSIWNRLLAHHGYSIDWRWNDGDGDLELLWGRIETLPDWQQVPLVLTFDTGVIPWQEYEWAADRLDEFDERLPTAGEIPSHVRAVAEMLRSGPEAPFFGVYGTSVTDNPFDPWDEEADDYGSGISASDFYLLERHREMALATSRL